MKRKLSLFLTVIMILSAMMLGVFSVTASAATSTAPNITVSPTKNGTCGTDAYWTYYEDTKTLYIYGENAKVTSTPWSSFGSNIKKIVIENEVESLDKGVFSSCTNVVEISAPFIGESRSATGHKAVTGWVFGYETIYCTSLVNNGTYYKYNVTPFTLYTIKFTGSLLTREFVAEFEEYYTDSKQSIYYLTDGIAKYCVYFSDSPFNWLASRTQYESSDYWFNKSYSDFKPYAGLTYQYSGFDTPLTNYKNYYYGLTSYFYYIPSSLKSYTQYNYSSSTTDQRTFTDGYETYTYTIGNAGIKILKCDTTSEAIVMPDTIEGYPVTEIGYKAFASNQNIKSVILPTSLAKVDAYAFYECANLENVTFGASVTEIGDYAFAHTALKRLSAPTSLKSIGKYAFSDCTSLSTVSLRQGLEELGTGAFYGDTLLATITLPNSLDEISDFAFANCTTLNNVTIPDSVKKIGSFAFSNCYSLATVTVNANVEIIAQNAFYACAVSSFNFGDSLKELGANAFSATRLQSVVLPNTLSKIGDQAFSDCVLLSDISIPDSATFGTKALYNNATNLKVNVRCNTGKISANFLYKNKIHTVEIEDGITSIGNYAFAECTDLVSVKLPNTLKTIGNYAFYKSKLSANINLPQTITSVGEYAFSQSSAVTNVSLPDSITSIGANAFDSVVAVNVYYRLGEIGKDIFNGQKVKAIFVDDNISKIGDGAFANCTNLVELSLPDTISSVGNGCFTSSSKAVLTIRTVDGKIDKEIYKGKLGSIASLIVDNSNIEDFAFADNTSLKNVTISAESSKSTITYIGKNAFSGCTALNALVVPNTVEDIGESAFSGCKSLKSINIPNGVSKIEKNTFYNCSALQSMVLPESVKEIGEYAFYGCSTMNSINIPYGVTIIPAYAFYGCEALESIEISDSVISIDSYAFYGCIALSSVDISNQCTAIMDYAFYNCRALQEIAIPSSVSTIGSYAFASCNRLKNIVLSDSINSIGEYAFNNCTALETVTIGSGLSRFENRLFGGCYNLTAIYIYSPLEYIDDYAFFGAEGVTAYIDSDAYMVNYFEDHAIAYVISDEITYKYTVIFKDENGDILFEKKYALGETVEMPSNPTKDADQVYTYKFVGWNNEVVVVDGRAQYTAVYEATYIEYFVMFVDDDGTFLSGESYHYGDRLNVPPNPTKASDNTYTYTFAGWSPMLSYCDGNITYTATYTADYIDYTVTFKDWNGNIISEQTCHYGDDVVVPTNPTREADNTYTYTFKAWDKNVVACSGDATYTATYDSSYIDYTVIFKDEDGTVLSTNTYHYGDAVTVPNAPTKAADNIYTYDFAGWNSVVAPCAGNTVYTATYSKTYINYTVTFKDEDGRVLGTDTYHYGENINVPATPSKASDKTYTYAFAGWDSEVVACDGNKIYTATYTPTFIDYTIIFADYDGDIISTKTYHYGDPVTAPSAPTRESDVVGSYTFKAWDKAVVACEGNTTYTATYNVSYTNYTVTFQNWNGDVISTQSYHYGDEIVVPDDPTRSADETYTYAFAGWDKTITKCDGNTTYTAQYTPTNVEYTVVFKDENGTVLSTKTYYYGATVVVPSDPTKAADNTYTYTFAGWDKEVVDCVADAIYTATYTPVYINYTITFTDYDGREIQTVTYHYGETIVAIADPTRVSDETYTYTFNGWDKALGTCKGNATFKATYTSTYIDYTVIFENEDGTVLSRETYHYGDKIVVPGTPSKEANNTYTYTFAGWDKSVGNCTGNATYTATYDANYINYTVTFKNEDGKVLSTKTYHYGEKVTEPATPTKAADNTYTYTFKAWDKTVVDCAGDAIYTATYDANYINYTVIFKDEDGTALSTKTYHYGEKVTEPATPTKAADNTYTYTFAGWDKTVVACDGDKVYTATYTSAYIEYTVVFKDWNGNEISSKEYHYGQAVTKPSNPTRAADNTYTYTFAGWDKTVTNCTESMVYTATYSSTYIDYEIVFKNYDDSIISKNTYHYGDPIVVPEAPTKPADASYTYGFAGWDSEVTACSGSKTYIATFNPTNVEYTVVFKDWNGNEISSEIYHFGDSIVVPNAPSRDADITYTYTFKDWGKTVAETCVGDAEYTAVYTATYIEYNIKFLDWDGSLIQTVKYHYGDTITAIADPERESDETYTYTFLSWNKDLGTCTGNASFTAQYESTYINYTVVFKDYDGSVISRKTYHFGDPITIPADPVRASDDTYSYTFKNWGSISTSCNGDKEYTAVYNAEYIDYTVIFNDYDGSLISTQTYHFGDAVTEPQNPTRAADSTYTYAFAGWNKTVVACDGDTTYTATYTPTFIDYTVEFKDYDGEVISTGTYHYGDAITVPTAPVRESDAIGSYTFKAWDNTVVNCAGDATYTATYEITYTDYTVIFKNEDGTVLSTETYHYGDAVTAPTTPTKDADNTYTYTFKAWDAEVVACAGDATYTATYDSAYIDYTVIFKDEDGTVLSSETYHYGDAVTAPTAPTKDADNTYTYTFKAWDAEVVACAGDAIYTATYTATEIEDESTPGTDENDGLSGGAIAGIATGSTVAAGAGGFSLFWFVIKKKRFSDLLKVFKKK